MGSTGQSDVTVSTPLLSLRGVNKSFGAVHVLRDVNLDVWAGQVTALVGDNGAGKSTLIKGIAGIYPFESGEIQFDGEPVKITAFDGDLGRFVDPPLAEGRRATGPDDVEIGTGLATALGLGVGERV